ncbi:MAG: lipopolysaccharide biosynthesis protein [Acidiferrobacter sp.]
MTLREIIRYAGTLYGANVAASLVTFGLTIVISRDVSRADLGLYGLFQAYFLFGAYASGLGLAPATVKWVAGGAIDDGEFLTFIVMRLAGISALLYLGAGLAYVLGFKILAAALVALPPYQAFSVALSAARARLWRRREALLLVVASLATSAWIFGLLFVNKTYWAPVLGQVMGAYTTAAVVLVYGLWRGRLRWKRPGAWRADFWRTAMPVFLGSSVFALGELADRLVIRHVLGLASLGVFVMALTLFNVLNKPVHMLSRVLLSHFSQADNGAGHAKAPEIVRVNLVVLPLMGLTAAAVLPWVIPGLLNRDYSAAFPVFAVLTVVILIKAVELVHSSLAVAQNSAGSNMRAQIVALLVYGGAVFMLARGFGLIGVAWAIVLRWMVLALVQRFDMRRRGVEVVPLNVLVRAGAAYLAALAFFPIAPWFMGIAYLIIGAALRLWAAPQSWFLAARRT